MTRNQIIAIKKAYITLLNAGFLTQASDLIKAFPGLELPECKPLGNDIY